jgi:hypothetical protein
MEPDARASLKALFSFDAFSSREPLRTSLENAGVLILTRFLHANRCALRSKTLR